MANNMHKKLTTEDRRVKRLEFQIDIDNEYIRALAKVLDTIKNDLTVVVAEWEYFARKFFCQHSRLNSIRADKKKQKKVMREISKRICRGTEKYDN